MNNFLQYMTVVLLLLVITEVAWLSRPKKRRQMEQISTLVDTSVLMDGRVIDLARTGFLLGQIIVQASRHQIQAYSASGQVLWERSLAPSCSPLVWQNRLFICNQEPTLLELHPDTGQVLHRRPLSAPPSTQPNASGQQLALALKDGQVVICNLP